MEIFFFNLLFSNLLIFFFHSTKIVELLNRDNNRENKNGKINTKKKKNSPEKKYSFQNGALRGTNE